MEMDFSGETPQKEFRYEIVESNLLEKMKAKAKGLKKYCLPLNKNSVKGDSSDSSDSSSEE